MGLFHNFPYTNFHELNLDWLVEQTKKNTDAIAQLEATPKAKVVRFKYTVGVGYSCDEDLADIAPVVLAKEPIIIFVDGISPGMADIAYGVYYDSVNQELNVSMPLNIIDMSTYYRIAKKVFVMAADGTITSTTTNFDVVKN